MSTEPTFFDVPVSGGELRVARWGEGPRAVLGIHGITATSIALAPIARHLGSGFTFYAPDLRGRGGSAALPGPFGMRAHAADCAAVLRQVASGPAVVVGHSMGAFVASVLGAEHPELVERVVLVDGGLIPPVPEGIDPGPVLDAVLGPALARLSKTFASADEYRDFWRAHPSFQDEWNGDIDAYLEYDLVPADGNGFRSGVSEEAVRADGTATILDANVAGDALRALRCPVHLVRAPRNLLNAEPPLIPEELVQSWQGDLPQLTHELVEDTNHYSIVFGERGAKTVAARVAGS